MSGSAYLSRGGIQFQLTVFFSILGNFSFKQGTKLQLQLLPAFLVSVLKGLIYRHQTR